MMPARTVGAGAVHVESGDSEDSSPFHVNRSRPVSAGDHDTFVDAVPPAAPSTEPSPFLAAPKRTRLGKLWRARAARSG